MEISVEWSEMSYFFVEIPFKEKKSRTLNVEVIKPSLYYPT